MPVIDHTIQIHAEISACFDLARNIDLHLKSMAETGEIAIAGKTAGLIGDQEEVTWEGRHFGLLWHHTAKITAFNQPHHFQDSMIKGAFGKFVHDHYFASSVPGRTTMRDVVYFRSPFWLFGRLVDWAVMTRYLHRLILNRQVVIKGAAEALSSI